MEIIEKTSLRTIQWLSQLSYKEFIATCVNPEKKYTKKDIQTKYSILQQFTKTNIKTQGITKRIYSYSLTTPLGLGGRLFSGGSIQGLPSKIRGLLMQGISTDIDMANAHPKILLYICKLHQLSCPQLEYYVNHRDECLSQFESRDIGKTAYLKATNNDKMNRTIQISEFKKYDSEMKKLQKKIVALPEYQEFIASVPYTKLYNHLGSAINRILCYYENMILQHAIHIINSKGIEIAILMFDGLMIYGDYYMNKELLNEITDYVESQMTGLNMKWMYKEHNTELVVPTEFDENKYKKCEIKYSTTFESIISEFEKSHLKIINKSLFIKHNDSSVMFMTQAQLKMSYSHLFYEVPKYDKNGNIIEMTSQKFIDKWISHTHDIRRKEDIDIYPNLKDCPEDIFNLWRPFAMEVYNKPYTYKQTELDFILNHIKILCNHEENVFDYFVKWIAQMIQYPHIKSIMPTLISKEGSGKGTLFDLLTKMLGSEKVFETTDPSRDVWGDFNGIMRNCFLVNLNELSKKDTMESEGKIKGLITDNALTINQKGIPQYKIKSYHRFITTTNKEDPFHSSKDDRRKLIIRCSDEKKNDCEYFNKFRELLEDNDVIKTCYEYFKSIKGMDKFREIPIPKTEYQDNLKELSKSPIESWLEDFVRENEDKEEVLLLGKDIFDLFKNWCIENGVKYETNCQKLGVKLINMNIKGILKGEHTYKGKIKIFNIPELKTTLNIGCLIK